MAEFAAFISYSHKYKPWVKQLQENLELCLKYYGAEPWKVFLDEIDLMPGSSWVRRLDQGLAKAQRLVLVITPEAMASPNVEVEWTTWVSDHPNWQRDSLVLPIELVEAPNTLATLNTIQRADFKDPDPDAYRYSLQRVLGVMLGCESARELPDLAPGLKIPGSQPPPCENPEPSPQGSKSADVSFNPIPPYLKLVREDLGRLLPLYEQDAESELLEHVYVSLSLQPDQQAKFRAKQLKFEPLSSTTLRGLLELDPADHAWVTRRWMVKGDPGAGKTTLLRHLASTLANEADPHWIPIFFSLPRMVRRGHSVRAMLERQLELAGIGEGAIRRFHELGEEGRLLLLLDGLDEVPEEKREEVEEALLGAMSAWPQTPIVVSTRLIGYERPHQDFCEVKVQPLDRTQQIEFLARRLRGEGQEPDHERARREIEVLDRHPNLRELAENPLYLTLMSFLIRDGIVLSGSRAQLYDSIFTFLLSGKHRRRRQTEKIQGIEKPDVVRVALRHLAYEMSLRNLDAARLEDLESFLRTKTHWQSGLEPWPWWKILLKAFGLARGDERKFEISEQREPDDSLLEHMSVVPRWQDSQNFFGEVGELTGILAQHDGEEEDWRYWHRTFREALTAETLEALHKEDERQVLEHAGMISKADSEGIDKSRWSEAYALLTGRLNEPDDLVLRLLEQDQDLGLRAFEGVQKLRETTLKNFLDSQNWQIRTTAYRRLPDLVETPERALQWIDELRKQTRNGLNLFFLDQAVQRTGERWPAARSAADRFRLSFYDHIPQPPEDLFRWIETKDGRVDLWRKIPAGSFLMGSPDGEGYDFEKPQHRVEILQPFQMACVPVTQEQFAAFDPEHKSYHNGAKNPVEQVTWFQAVAFCNWLAQAFPWAKGARLPIEAEWEYACRAGTTTRYWSGDDEKDLGRNGWYDQNSSGTHPVGEKPANPWGLYDVHGNVDEWTLGGWTSNYEAHAQGRAIDPAKINLEDPPKVADLPPPSAGSGRVVRGGSYWFYADGARGLSVQLGPGVRVREPGLSGRPASPSSQDPRR